MNPTPNGDRASKKPAPSGTGHRRIEGYSAVFATVFEVAFLGSTTS